MATSVDDDNEELANEIRMLLDSAPPYPPTPFESMLPYIEQHSITAKMFRNEYLNLKDSGVMNGKTPVLEKKETENHRAHLYYVPLPRNRSCFTFEDMNELFPVYKASLQGATLNATQKALLAKEAQNLKAENAQFLQLVSKVWLDDSWKRKSVVKPEVSNFVAAWLKARMPRVKNYPSIYKPICSISLTPLETEVNLSFIEQVYSIGRPARLYTLASAHSNFTCNLNSINLTKEMLKGQCIREKLKGEMKNDPLLDVSLDPLAEKFALQHQAQLVLTPSVLAVILSNNPLSYEEEWTLPFCVKDSSVGDHNPKIIFMDKKLPPKSFTPVEKNGIFFKVATKTFFRKHLKNRIKLENQDDACSSGEELPEADVSLPEARVRKEVQYNLWECQPSVDHSVLSKHHRKPFKILIKTSAKYNAIDSKKNLKPCVMSTKLDYQPEYGAEISSFREISREWIGLMTHHNAFLHRVRVDPIRGTTIMVEEKSIAQLAIDCQRLHSRNIFSQLSILQNLFDNISTLPVGNYLLNHRVKDAGFMFVYHEHEKSSRMNLDLTESYAAVDSPVSPENTHAPWVPLDTTIITPTLHFLRRIPCALPPSKIIKMKRPNIRDDRPRVGASGCSHEGMATNGFQKRKTNSKKRKNKKKKDQEKKNSAKNNTSVSELSGVGTNDDHTLLSYEDLCAKMMASVRK